MEFLSNTQPSLRFFQCPSELAARRGCGKTRHLQLKLLWLQEKLAAGAFQLHLVPTKNNLSGLQTKSLKAERQQFLLRRSPSGMSSILRALLAAIESAESVGALGLATCDRADSVLPGFFLVYGVEQCERVYLDCSLFQRVDSTGMRHRAARVRRPNRAARV